MIEVIYQVAPRYTGGSPAQVDMATAERVAREERAAYHELLKQQEVNPGQDNLDGIAEMLYEQQKCWLVTDLITGKQTTRPFEHQKQEPARVPSPAAERKQQRVRDLRALARQLIEAEMALDGSRQGMPEDPGLDYLLMDLNALRCRVTYLADQREMGRA